MPHEPHRLRRCDITAADSGRAVGFAHTLALAKGGTGIVLEVCGEHVAQLGLLAIRLDRVGVPMSAMIPGDEVVSSAITIAQSNPRRVVEEDDGA